MISADSPQKIIVKTMAGCEEILKEELLELGCKEPMVLTRAVMTEGGWNEIYAINYASRLALSVLVNISNFSATNYDDIYAGASKVRWDQFMGLKDTFLIRHAINSSDFSHTQLCALKVKDAIADYFSQKFNKRPSVEKENPNVIFHLHISGNKCQLLIDTSGIPLYKRGYKRFQGFAPLNEILAAALVRWSEWDGDRVLIDPFCGSGTLLTEAYLRAIKRPAGYYRKEFGFMKMKGFNEVEWKAVRQKFDQMEIPYAGNAIYGFDNNESILRSAQKNLDAIGASRAVSLQHKDFFDFQNGQGDNMLIMNPPYGKRIEHDDESFFSHLSSFLKHHCPGNRVVIIAPKELINKIGFKPAFKIPVFNGEIECYAIGFELFKGSKKS